MNEEWWGVVVAGLVGLAGLVVAVKANRLAKESHALASEVRDENLKLKAAVLTVVDFEVGLHGSEVSVKNNGDTRADNVLVRFENDNASAFFGFDPRPRAVIEAHGTEQFWCPARREDFLDGRSIISTDLRLTWSSPLGVQSQVTVRHPPNLDAEAPERD